MEIWVAKQTNPIPNTNTTDTSSASIPSPPISGISATLSIPVHSDSSATIPGSSAVHVF